MKYTFSIEVDDLVSSKNGKKYNPSKKELDKALKKEFNYLYNYNKSKLERFDLVYDMENFKYEESLLLSGDENQIKYMISVIKNDYTLTSSELCKENIISLDFYNYNPSFKLNISDEFSFKAYEYLLGSKYFILNKNTEDISSESFEDYNKNKKIKEYKELKIYDILSIIAKNIIIYEDKINIETFIKYNIHLDIYKIINLFEKINEKISSKNLKVIDINEAIKKYINLYIDLNGEVSFDELIKDYIEEYYERDYQKRDYLITILNHINELKYDSIYYSENYKVIDLKQLENALNAFSVNNKEDKHYDLIIEYIKYFNSSELAFKIIFNYSFMKNLPAELIENDKFVEIVNLLKDSESFLRSIGYNNKLNWEKNIYICNIVDGLKKESLKAINDLSEDEAKTYLFDIVNKYYPDNEKVIKALLDK